MRWFDSDQTSFAIDPSGPGIPVFMSWRERARVREAERLELDPLARDPSRWSGSAPRSRASATSFRTCTSSDGLQREAERPALVQERRHRDLPAAADLAEDVLDGHLEPP